MKVRTGFVSNSSGSSFLIYGFCMDDEELEELFRVIGLIKDSDDGYELWSMFEGGPLALLKEQGFDYYTPLNSDGVYIGRSWDQVGDNQTGQQFKDETVLIIKKVFGDDIEVGTHEEHWGQ